MELIEKQDTFVIRISIEEIAFMQRLLGSLTDSDMSQRGLDDATLQRLYVPLSDITDTYGTGTL